MEEKERILRRKDRGVLMQVKEQKQNKGRRSRFRAGLELRGAKYLVLRVFTTVYFWIFTTPLAKFLSPSNLQRKNIKILWDQLLTGCISCVGACAEHSKD